MRIQKAPCSVGGTRKECWARREGKRLHAREYGDIPESEDPAAIGVIGRING